ncbi:MAG TPA: hypothetical protein VH277_07315 [Gemmatimonadaceae bacterium]|nr:hypothetical protein [Gemmatimonadaceae bacterium]
MDKHERDEGDAGEAPASSDEAEAGAHAPTDSDGRVDSHEPNPPRTTKWGITAPKFGSAGSGGAEYEPGPERD